MVVGRGGAHAPDNSLYAPRLGLKMLAHHSRVSSSHQPTMPSSATSKLVTFIAFLAPGDESGMAKISLRSRGKVALRSVSAPGVHHSGVRVRRSARVAPKTKFSYTFFHCVTPPSKTP